jgi:hypothetical protein
MTPADLTLPLVVGERPFRLSEEEAAFNGDDWAWLFLRLNPLYRHDYMLYRGSPDPQWQRLKETIRPGNLLCPSRSYGTAPQLPRAWAALDSRYFSVEKHPLTSESDGVLPYAAVSLEDYLKSDGDPSLLAKIKVRDFDAPRDYGIGTWVDPKEVRLARLPQGCSWFFYWNEPLWHTNTIGIKSPPAIFHVHTDGSQFQVGSTQPVAFFNGLTMYRRGEGWQAIELLVGTRLPANIHEVPATLFDFLVCLDGYIEPQVNRVRPIAAAIKERHRSLDRASVARGNAIGRMPEIFDPGSPARADRTLPISGHFRDMTRDPSRMRKHWRQVSIDLAGPLKAQLKAAVDALKAEQHELRSDFPLAQRSRTRVGTRHGDHWLKQALCAVELHLGAFRNPQGSGFSQEAMARAFYNDEYASYWSLRGLPPPPPNRQSTGGKKTRDSELGLTRRALSRGHAFVQHWYEFLSTLEKP